VHLVAPAIGVNPHARTAGTTEKIVHGLLRDFSDDVPQRLLDTGGGAMKLERAAALRIVVEGDLQDMTDMECLAAEFLDLCGDGTVAIVLAVGLPPSDDAGIGRNPHEHEIFAPT
jgi:hypothetical protein